MKLRFFSDVLSGREDGAILIFVVFGVTLMFVGLTSLAVDATHMVMVRNELQIAADAGALAGAGVLINPADGSINTNATIEADAVSRENPAAGADRTVGSSASDKLDVVAKRGHWSFTTETFTENNATEQLAGWEGMSAATLDVNTNFINAVQVTTIRDKTKGIFTNIFGWKSNRISADAVAYLGYAASVPPNTVDIPFAVCEQFITVDDHLSCGVARATNEGVETGGWTNFSQDSDEGACESSNAADVNSTNPLKPGLLADIPPCKGLNDYPLTFGKGIGSINGNVSSSFALIVEHCFVNADGSNADIYYQNSVKYNAIQPWLDVTLPVVDCATNNYGGGTLACDDTNLPFVGVVTLDILWMSAGKNNVPVKYQHHDMNNNDVTFICSDPSTPETCWQEFQTTFGFSFPDPDGDGLPEDNGIYFAPGCKYTEPAGGVGSDNYGIMAKVPVLVE